MEQSGLERHLAAILHGDVASYYAAMHRVRAVALVELGRPDEARAAAADMLRLAPGFRGVCLTTWTKRSIRWSGFTFRSFYEAIVEPRAKPHPGARLSEF